jgi:hypothetical protein
MIQQAPHLGETNQAGGDARGTPARAAARPRAGAVSQRTRLAKRVTLGELLVAQATESCPSCLARRRGCPACTQRRRTAVRLREAGMAADEIGRQMSLSVERVERLLEQNDDRRALEKSSRDRYVSNVQLRALFELRKRQDPTLNASELARRAGMASPTVVERDLGLMAVSDTTSKGRLYPGYFKDTVLVSSAERLLRGLGSDPRDVEVLLAGDDLVTGRMRNSARRTSCGQDDREGCA